ncbi:MAG: type II secretion system protein [Planctomycetaceae bacterium]
MSTPQITIHRRRSGFTLLELLMVVAVIAILMSLTFVVMAGVVQQAEEEATKVTILKVNRLLEQRIEAFDRAFKGSRRDDYVRGTVLLLRQIDGRFDYFEQHPDEAPPAILLLARKAGFRFEFPQRNVELVAGFDTPPTGPGLSAAVSDTVTGLPGSVYRKQAYPIARTQLVNEGTANPTITQINTRVSENYAKHQAYEATAATSEDVHSSESAELLYFTLISSGTFGSSPVDADSFTSAEVGDIDEDGLPEFLDAWGNPLRWYRWPTRLIDPTAPNPFAPDFFNANDPTEVDPVPDNIDGIVDGEGREITNTERDYAGLIFKGLPPQSVPILDSLGNPVTQRDLLLVDPDDPVGILYTFIEDPKYINMGIDLTQEFNEAKYHTPDTYHAPLVISAGPDERLGLREPNDFNAGAGIFGNLAQYAGTTAASPNPVDPAGLIDQLSDNISNRNRRMGGRR